MRSLIFALVGVVLAASHAVAQLSIQVRVPKETFLVYESLPVTISIHNFSGRTIQLQDSGDTSWLSFMVTSEGNRIVPAIGKINTSEPVLVPPGETIARTVDLLPIFEIRGRGTYHVQASVNAAGVQANSPAVALTLMKGRELWTQTVGLPTVPGEHENYCTYSLVARHQESQDLLYVSVQVEPASTIYSLIPLGEVLPNGGPDVKVDREGHLHVLFQNAPRAYGYVEIDSRARMSGQAAYSDYMSRPELTTRDGIVTVTGGEQTYPLPDHILSDDELKPPAPPPKPKPKKKWWWPFGPSSPPADSAG